MELIRTAVFHGEEGMLEVLLDAGFPLNCKPNGGSPALDVLLEGGALSFSVPVQVFGKKGEGPRYRDDKARALLDAIKSFVDQGAMWVPDLADRNSMRHIRDVLLALGEEYAGTLLELLLSSGAAQAEDVKALLKTARMKRFAQALKVTCQ